MLKAGIIGATGYTGSEIVDCLAGHPGVDITELAARNEKPVPYSKLYPRFRGKVDIACKMINADNISSCCDVVFLALPHTVSMEYVPQFLSKNVKVIDMSADYRLPPDIFKDWFSVEHADKGNFNNAVYGLPELNKDKIKKADLIANPGCYPTSVVLGLLPIIDLISIKGLEPIIDSKSGTTGAGKKASVELSFSEVSGNLKCYKANEHQHIPEMEHILSGAAGKDVKVHFAPHLLPVRRGIMSTMYIRADGMPSADELADKFNAYYKDAPFVRVRESGQMPGLSDVVNSNFCDIGIKSAKGMIIIVSVIDNLLKGAAGQAVQNMNIMFGLDETAGLM